MKSFCASGDLGDIIYSLPAVKRLGGGVYYFVNRPLVTKPFTLERMGALAPLLEFQSYIERVVKGEPPEPVTHSFVDFRNGAWIYGDTLVARHARWVGVNEDGAGSWLSAPESSVSKNRIVVHRSPRYQNRFFPWRKIGEFYGDRILCVGFGEEVAALQKQLGFKAEHVAVQDYLELASLIGSADLFIGNQSSPMAVAIGLGVPFIQETCDWMPDCIYRRANAQFIYDGGVVLPGLGQGEDEVVKPFIPVFEVDEFVAPPGGWRYGTHRDLNLFELCRRVETLSIDSGEPVTRAEVRKSAIASMVAQARLEHYRQHRTANFGKLDEIMRTLGVDIDDFSSRIIGMEVLPTGSVKQ